VQREKKGGIYLLPVCSFKMQQLIRVTFQKKINKYKTTTSPHHLKHHITSPHRFSVNKSFFVLRLFSALLEKAGEEKKSDARVEDEGKRETWQIVQLVAFCN
jgi:hypothetical protein